MTLMAVSESEIQADGCECKAFAHQGDLAASRKSGRVYDFTPNAFTSIYFASAFSSGDQTSQLLATAGIFAVGFSCARSRRLFGWIAEHTRKNSMWLSVLLYVRRIADDRNSPTIKQSAPRRCCCSLRRMRRQGPVGRR